MNSTEIAKDLVSGLPSMKMIENAKHLSIKVKGERELIVLKDRYDGIQPGDDIVVFDTKESLSSYEDDYSKLQDKSVIIHSELLNEAGQKALDYYKNNNSRISIPFELLTHVNNLAVIMGESVNVIKSRYLVFPIEKAIFIKKEDFLKLNWIEVVGKTYLVNFN